MICVSCREAGRFNQAANAMLGTLADESATALLRKSAEETHKGCPGGTRCDCQHVVSRVLRIIPGLGEAGDC